MADSPAEIPEPDNPEMIEENLGEEHSMRYLSESDADALPGLDILAEYTKEFKGEAIDEKTFRERVEELSKSFTYRQLLVRSCLCFRRSVVGRR